MKVTICNAFSLSMLEGDADINFRVCNDPADWLARLEGHAEIESAVGHQSTADLFAALLGRPVEARRVSVTLPAVPGHCLLVGQYSGPRLEEGATTLPEGATIRWWVVGHDNERLSWRWSTCDGEED